MFQLKSIFRFNLKAKTVFEYLGHFLENKLKFYPKKLNYNKTKSETASLMFKKMLDAKIKLISA